MLVLANQISKLIILSRTANLIGDLRHQSINQSIKTVTVDSGIAPQYTYIIYHENQPLGPTRMGMQLEYVN